jgi:IMP dehydrogenase
MTLIENEKTYSYDDVCLVPTYSDLESRWDANVEMGYYTNPMINSPMIHTSGKRMLKYMVDNRMCPTVHRYFDSAHDQFNHVKDALRDDFKHVFFAVGRDKNWINTLHNLGVTKYCVDMAHGDSKVCVDSIELIKSLNSHAVVMAGNVATHAGYVRLRTAGADYIRVGIAGGSICSTAKNTAFGLPMVTSIMECAEAKKVLGGILVADGGIRSASDMLKAIAAGADMCMVGKILASTSEAQGPFYDDGDTGYEVAHYDCKYVEYAGMASHEMRMRNSSHTADENTSIEGVAGLIKYTGTTDSVIKAINANLRAGLSYCGSRNWDEFKQNAVMRLMSTAGILEKETHLDIKV